MSWEAEQDRITREGRLYFAPPEVVFAELKQLGRRNRREIWSSSSTEALEAKLIERNDQLINIGLACYCTNKDVFTALYKHSKEPPLIRDVQEIRHHYRDSISYRVLVEDVAITCDTELGDPPPDVAKACAPCKR
jgi:hypothetical protein